MTINLSPETEATLKRVASERGLEPSEYARRVIEEALTTRPVVDQATIDLLDQWDREDATDDPEEIARRQQEVKEFMDGMNRNRLEMEGPTSRKVYP